MGLIVLNGGTFDDIQNAVNSMKFRDAQKVNYADALQLIGAFSGNSPIVFPSGKTGLTIYGSAATELIQNGNGPIFEVEGNHAVSMSDLVLRSSWEGQGEVAPLVLLHNCSRTNLRNLKCLQTNDSFIRLTRDVPDTDTLGTRISYCGALGPFDGYADTAIDIDGGPWGTVYLYRNIIGNFTIGAHIKNVEYLFLNNGMYRRCQTGIQIENLAHPEMQSNWYRNVFPECTNEIVIV